MATCIRQNKIAPTLSAFEFNIKAWTTDNRRRKLSKMFVKDLGFVEIGPNL